jgi:flagellar hook-associated protein 2
MSSVGSFTPLQFGSINTDPNTGQTRMAPKIMGSVDVNQLIQDQVNVINTQTMPYQNQISNNTNIISTLNTFQGFIQNLSTTATALDLPLVPEVGFQSLYEDSMVNAYTANGTAVGNYANLISDTNTPLNFTIQITQTAKNDTRSSNASVTNIPTAGLGLSGNLILDGHTIPVNNSMSIEDIANQVNTLTATTDVTASVTSLTGDGANYVITFYSSQIATPIQLSTSTASVLNGLGLSTTNTTVTQLSAAVVYNGNTYYRPTNANITDIVSGITIDVFQPSPIINASVQPNLTGVANQIQTFITQYNQIVDFIAEQNKYDSENPEVSGDLFGNTMLFSIKNILNGVANPVTGITPGNFASLSAIGINIDNNNHLVVNSSNTFGNALYNQFSQVQNIFANNVVNSNSNFMLTSFGPSLNSTLAGQNITVSIQQLANSSYSATLTCGGTTVPALINGTSLEGPPGSIFQNFTFNYSSLSSLTPGGAADTTIVNVTQGIVDTLNNQLEIYLTPSTGTFATSIQQYTTDSKNIQKQIQIINDRANSVQTSLQVQYDRVLQAYEKYDSITSMLNSFMAVMSGNTN